MFQCFDIIELHHGLEFETPCGKDAVESLASRHFRGERYDLALGKIRKVDRTFFEKGMARGTNDVEGILLKRFYLEAFSGGWECDKADVGIPCGNRFVHFVGAAVIDLNFDLGKRFEKIFDVGR